MDEITFNALKAFDSLTWTLSTQSSFSLFFSLFIITFTHEKRNKLLENVCENIILQILSRISPHLVEKSLMENVIFCADFIT